MSIFDTVKLVGEKVLDGDTIIAGGESVRLTGMDAPEMAHGRQAYEPGAVLAARYVADMMPEMEITSDGERDQYGRQLASAEVNDQPANEAVIRAGLAQPFFDTASEDENAAVVQGFVRRMNPAARTVVDAGLDAERALAPVELDFTDRQSWFYKPEDVFSRAVDRGAANLQTTLGASAQYLGEKLGFDWLRETGERGVSRGLVNATLNPAEVESFEDIDGLAELGTWTMEKVGENIATIGSTAIGGIGGAALAAGIGKATLKAATKEAAAIAMKRMATIGARTGAIATTYPQHLGEGALEMRDAGKPMSNLPFLTAAINTVLDVAPMEAVLRYTFRGMDPKLAGDLVKTAMGQSRVKAALLDVAKGWGVGAISEAPTEFAQELVNLTARASVDPTFDWGSPEVKSRLVEAAAGGLAVGGAFGGAGGAARGALRMLAKDWPEELPPTADAGAGTPPPTPPALPGAPAPVDPTAPTDNSGVIPESPEQIGAQVGAMLDPSSTKDSVLVTPGAEVPTVPEATTVDMGPTGVLLTTNPEKAAVAEQYPDGAPEPVTNEILYNGAGSQTKEGTLSVEGRNDQGQIVTQMVANPGPEAESAVREASAQAPAVTVNTVEDAVAERQQAQQPGIDLSGARPHPYLAKDKEKAAKANKMIGRGSARSSTNLYAQLAGDRANAGVYEPTDRVFVSAEGNRGGRVPPDFEELGRAADAGATFITDDEANRGRPYNVGEREVAEFLTRRGYAESEPGVWAPAAPTAEATPAPSTEPAFSRMDYQDSMGGLTEDITELSDEERREIIADAVDATPAAQTYVDKLLESLGIKARVEIRPMYLHGKVGGTYNHATGIIDVRHKVLIALAAEKQPPGYTNTRESIQRAAALEILFHELGHFIHRTAYDGAPKAIRDAIDREYQKYRASALAGGSAREARAARSQPTIAASLRARSGDQPLRDYDYSFEEWMADNIGRVLTNQEIEVQNSLVERFFERTAKLIRNLYQVLSREANINPKESVARFVDYLREQAAAPEAQPALTADPASPLQSRMDRRDAVPDTPPRLTPYSAVGAELPPGAENPTAAQATNELAQLNESEPLTESELMEQESDDDPVMEVPANPDDTDIHISDDAPRVAADATVKDKFDAEIEETTRLSGLAAARKVLRAIGSLFKQEGSYAGEETYTEEESRASVKNPVVEYALKNRAGNTVFSATVRSGKSGNEIKLNLPPRVFGDGELTANRLVHLVRAAFIGTVKGAKNSRIEVPAPDGTKVRFNLAGLAIFGLQGEATLSKATPFQLLNAVMRAMEFLQSIGFDAKMSQIGPTDVVSPKQNLTWTEVSAAGRPKKRVKSALVSDPETDAEASRQWRMERARDREEERRRRARGVGFDPKDEREEELGAPEPDVRRFDSESEQMEESIEAGVRPTKSLSPEPPKTNGARLAEGVTDERLTGEAEVAATLLREVGVALDRDVVFLDDAAFESIPASGDVNEAILRDARDQKPGARVMFIERGDGTVTPYIYISNALKGKARAEAIIHELGHIVMRQFIAGASENVKTAIRDAFGEPGTVEFEENFADAFVSYMLKNATRANPLTPAHGRLSATVKNLFERIKNALRSLFTKANKALSVDRKWEDFIETLVNRRRRVLAEKDEAPTTAFGRQLQRAMEADLKYAERNGERVLESGYINELTLRPTSLTSLDFRPLNAPARAAVARRAQQLADSAIGRTTKSGWSVMAGLYRSWLQPLDSVMRGIGNAVVTRLANDFRRIPGRETMHDRVRMDDEMRGEEKPFMDRVRRIAEAHVPGFKPWHLLPWVKRPPISDELKAATRELMDGNPQSPLAKEIRALFDDLYDWVRKAGIYVPRRKNYFPVAMKIEKLLRDGSHARVSEIVEEWAETDTAKKWWAEKFEGELLTRERAARFADHLVSVWLTGQGQMEEESDGGMSFMAPGFGFRKQRQLPPDLIAALDEFREDDVVELLTRYTRSAIRRGMWQKRYGAHDELAAIDEMYERSRADKKSDTYREAYKRFTNQNGRLPRIYKNAEGQWRDETRGLLLKEADEFKQKRVDHWKNVYGVDLYDPSAGLKRDLLEERRASRISQDQLDYLNDVAIPSYMGTLGADFSINGKPMPGLRKFSQLVMVYQAMRVLSLAVLSQIVDIGTMAARIPSGERYRLVKESFKLFSKSGRAELKQMAEMLGRWQHDITDHTLNDEIGLQGMSANMSRLNEWFFRANGMHAATNWARAVDASIARQLIEAWAREGNTKNLGQLGITPAQAKAWLNDGKPMTWSNKHATVLGGINQFIDESIVHPTAANRPRFGNDRRYMVFFHLKSFIYGFQTQILQRAWEESKSKWGETEGLRRLYAAMPFLTLAAFTLPLAAAGMELRWLISPPKMGEPEGWDYAWETVKRSGNLGLVQFLVDMYETEQHGKVSLIAPLGPTVGQLYDFGTQDLSSTLPRALPAYPILSWLGRAVTQE